MPGPCQPENDVAQQILQSCVEHFAANDDDCNKFLKAALGVFLADGYFEGMNADAIVGKLKQANEGWRSSRRIATAIERAKAGDMVIAGMTSAALGASHGHLAIVVGCDGQPSSGKIVPLGYAGSLGNPSARLEGGRLSGTFLATMVRSEQLDVATRS